MEAQTNENAVLEGLDSQADETLHAVIERAKSLLATRKNQRQAQALAEIRRLITEIELDCEVKRRGRKRGRPRKVDVGEA